MKLIRVRFYLIETIKLIRFNLSFILPLSFCVLLIVNSLGAGPALLKRKKRLSELFEALSSWRKTTSLKIGAIGCKIRLGLNQSEQNKKIYLHVVDLAQISSLGDYFF